MFPNSEAFKIGLTEPYARLNRAFTSAETSRRCRLISCSSPGPRLLTASW